MGRVFFNTRKNIHSLDGAYQCLDSDSGKIFVLNAAAGAAITLPTVANTSEGWNAKFIVGTAFATSDWTIVASAAVIKGGVNELTDSVGPSTAGATTINLELAADTVGDYYELVFDGTQYWLNGQSAADGAVTFS
mgnify:CR=1 FL=1|tara:strand:- start:453 stop:857 length:405 start_codon:yes stop_codon:yes gene_type:complete